MSPKKRLDPHAARSKPRKIKLNTRRRWVFQQPVKPIRGQTGLNKIAERVTPGGGPIETHGTAVRICVSNENHEPAINCEGFLTRIEFRDSDEKEFIKLPLYEPHLLPWALDEFIKVTIKKDVPRYLGVVTSWEIDGHFSFRSGVTSNSTKSSFTDIGEYRFYGAIAADVGGTTPFIIGIIWNGRWDKIKAWLVENI